MTAGQQASTNFQRNGNIAIANQTVFTSVAGTTATAKYTIDSGGDITGTQGTNSEADIGDWISPRVGMALCAVRATLFSGTLPSGTLGSFLALTSPRQWVLSMASVGGASCILTIEIKDSVGLIKTAQITMNATRTS
jgi:hypothetical protein